MVKKFYEIKIPDSIEELLAEKRLLGAGIIPHLEHLLSKARERVFIIDRRLANHHKQISE